METRLLPDGKIYELTEEKIHILNKLASYKGHQIKLLIRLENDGLRKDLYLDSYIGNTSDYPDTSFFPTQFVFNNNESQKVEFSFTQIKDYEIMTESTLNEDKKILYAFKTSN